MDLGGAEGGKRKALFFCELLNHKDTKRSLLSLCQER